MPVATTTVVAYIPAYVNHVGGDVLAALMFSQIAYWNGYCQPGKSRLKVMHQGRKWLAKSAPQWLEELGMTKRQSRRCVAVLVSHGLIETHLWKFNGSPTTHIVLTPKGREVILKCHQGHSHLTPKATPSALQGKSLTDTTAETFTESTTDIHPAGEPAWGTHTENQNLKNSKEEKIGKVGEEKNNVAALITAWNAHMLESNPHFQKQLTKQEIGQLQQFRNKVGIQAPDALAFALKNWGTFAWKVQFAKGKSFVPSACDVGFLLKHHDVLMTMIAKDQEEQKQIAEKEFNVNEMPAWHKKFDYEQWVTYLATHKQIYPATVKEMSEWVAKTYHAHHPHH